jgi:hypothetical protein
MRNHRIAAAASSSIALLIALAGVTGCGHATRAAAPQTGTAALTAATTSARGMDGPRPMKLLVADRGAVTMVTRDGCVRTIADVEDQTGGTSEMRVRCPERARIAAWFANVDSLAKTLPLEAVPDDDSTTELPAAEMALRDGSVFRVTNKADAQRLVREVEVLSNELAKSEVPHPGPASPGGWQMLRVAGRARVSFGGEPTLGMLDAQVSTSGQYYCEFVATTSDGPLHATKSGQLGGGRAARAIDEVLGPFQATDSQKRTATYAAGTASNTEKRANEASTAQVFERFAGMQDALGDACLPELEPPAPIGL